MIPIYLICIFALKFRQKTLLGSLGAALVPPKFQLEFLSSVSERREQS